MLQTHLEADWIAEQPLVALLEVDDRDRQAQQQLGHLRNQQCVCQRQHCLAHASSFQCSPCHVSDTAAAQFMWHVFADFVQVDVVLARYPAPAATALA